MNLDTLWSLYEVVRVFSIGFVLYRIVLCLVVDVMTFQDVSNLSLEIVRVN